MIENSRDHRPRPILKATLAAAGAATGLLVALLLLRLPPETGRRTEAPQPDESEQAGVEGVASDQILAPTGDNGRGLPAGEQLNAAIAAIQKAQRESRQGEGAEGRGAQSARIWGDAISTGREQLEAYDPRLRQVMLPLTRTILRSTAMEKCGLDRARHFGRSWGFQAAVRLNARVQGGQISFPTIEFLKHGLPNDGDDDFHSCLAETIPSLTFPCDGCREGEVAFDWGLNRGFNIHPDGRAYTREEVRAEARARGFGSMDETFFR